MSDGNEDIEIFISEMKKKIGKENVEFQSAIELSVSKVKEKNGLYNLGTHLMSKYPKLAFKCFDLGSVEDANCEFQKGICYWNGKGTKKSLKESYNTFLRLYQKKYSHASFLLAHLFYPHEPMPEYDRYLFNEFVQKGIVKINLEKALWYLKKAADFLPFSPFYVYSFAEVMHKGEIVVKNIDYAIKYYEKVYKEAEMEKIKEDKYVVKALKKLSKIHEHMDTSKSKEFILKSENFGNKKVTVDLMKVERNIMVNKRQTSPYFRPKLKLDKLLAKIEEMDDVERLEIKREVKIEPVTPPSTPFQEANDQKLNTPTRKDTLFITQQINKLKEEEKVDIKTLPSPNDKEK